MVNDHVRQRNKGEWDGKNQWEGRDSWRSSSGGRFQHLPKKTFLNVPVMGASLEAALADRNLPAVGGGAIGGFVIGSFVVGILLWFGCHAAIRPRFGAGPQDSRYGCADRLVLAYAWPHSSRDLWDLCRGTSSPSGSFWGLAEMILAALAGGRIYKEA